MNEIKYHKVGDFYYPNLKTGGKNLELSHFGRKLLTYLKEEKKVKYLNMLIEGTLISYLELMDREMNKQYEILIEQYKVKRHITEELKLNNQLQWVQEMNNINNCVEEIIYREYIYK